VKRILFLAAVLCVRAAAQNPCDELAISPVATFPAQASGDGWHRVGLGEKCKWSATTAQSWIKLGNTWGWGQEPLWYGIAENKGQARFGTIEVTSESGVKRVIKVRQIGPNEPLDRVVTVPQVLTFRENTVNQVLKVHRSGILQRYNFTSFDILSDLRVGQNPNGLVISQVLASTRQETFDVIATGALNSPLRVPIVRRMNPCAVAVTPNLRSFGWAGGAGMLSVSADEGCKWELKRSADWLTTSLIGTPKGTRLIPFQLSPNLNATPRTGWIEVGGMVVQLDQAGRGQPDLFTDVVSSHPFANFIHLMRLHGITKGCKDGTQFCPDQSITRAEFAVFLVRAVFGTDEFFYEPDPKFVDVPPSHPFFRHIQKITDLYSTWYTPNGLDHFGPNTIVTRQEAAYAITALKFGGSPDVLPGNDFEDFKAGLGFTSPGSKMKEQGITLGCSATKFCPTDNVTRGQMAVFLTRAFLTK
jgi:hypothetical protein